MSPERATGRVFVGLFLGEELGRDLAGAVAPALGGTRFRPLGAADLHLTLVFLGPLGRALLEPLAAALGETLGTPPRPAFTLEGTGAFPDEGRARVLWTGVGEPVVGELLALRGKVRAGVAAAGVELHPEERFHPHVSVARARRAPAPLPEAFARLALRLAWCPKAVELVESAGGAGPSRYAVHARFPFAGAG